MRNFIASNLLLLMFLVGAGSGLFLTAAAWWSLQEGARDLVLMHNASATLLDSTFALASAHNSAAGNKLLVLALLASAFFSGAAFMTWRRTLAGRRERQELAHEHALFKTLFDGSRDAIVLLEQDRIIDCNQAALSLFGAAGAAQLERIEPARLQPARQPGGVASVASWGALRADHAGHDVHGCFEWDFLALDGRKFTADVSVTAARSGDTGVTQLIMRDITARKLAEAAMRLSDQAFQSSLEGIAITDAEHNILNVNPAFSTITGYSYEEVMGRNPRILNSGRQSSEFYQEMWSCLDTRQEWKGEIWNIRKNGEIYPQWLNITRVCDVHGQTTNYVGIFSDISELKDAHARNLHAVYHDQLTQLPNSVLLVDRLQQRFAHVAAEPGEQIALMFMDVNRLKIVNDSMGRDAGDQLLQMVGARLKLSTRPADTLARMNGDEFAILLSKLDSTDDPANMARQIVRSFEQPFALNGEMIHVSLSIGVSLYPSDCDGPDALLQNAAMAMYRAKKNSAVAFELYDQRLGAEAVHRLAIEMGLRQALERDQLELHYQPQYECRTGRLTGFEALLRWHHPERGLVAPAAFLAVAEETGIIVPIGAWVLQTACAQAQAWRSDTSEHRMIAVNLSARQLQHPDIVQQVISALENSGLPANCLELEITESMMMHDVDASIDVMHRLSALGVEFSIDDFGTGYSSLAYLKKMPIKALKIDQSFIRDIVTNNDGALIVGAIVAMSNTLGLRVVAEGIENSEQLAHLNAYPDIIGQGYLLGRPVAAESMSRIVAELAPERELSACTI